MAREIIKSEKKKTLERFQHETVIIICSRYRGDDEKDRFTTKT